MFNRKNFINYNGQNRGSELINEWKYVSEDGLSEVMAADYFKDVQKLLSTGDIIRVYLVSQRASEETYYRASVDLRLSSESGHVNALPQHKHAYKLPIDLLNMGGAEAVRMRYCALN
jgi:hypothetical protein